MKKLSILIVSMLIAFQAQAQGIDAKQIFFGGGLSINDIDYGDNATGFQIFAGLPIPVNMGKASLSGEVGYMDSGNFKKWTPSGNVSGGSAEGIWVNAVVEVPVNKNIDLVGRAGLDLGDDDGLMIGGGIGIPVNNKIDLRFEYVIRDNIDSLQANIVIRQ